MDNFDSQSLPILRELLGQLKRLGLSGFDLMPKVLQESDSSMAKTTPTGRLINNFNKDTPDSDTQLRLAQEESS